MKSDRLYYIEKILSVVEEKGKKNVTQVKNF